mmetsp:Transcript_73766/g.196640  ORF Transcript_73766/g.196640 Transcript_73766/m.196640 type:complete len:213 (+) Transcript_73766:148-786(+)
MSNTRLRVLRSGCRKPCTSTPFATILVGSWILSSSSQSPPNPHSSRPTYVTRTESAASLGIFRASTGNLNSVTAVSGHTPTTQDLHARGTSPATSRASTASLSVAACSTSGRAKNVGSSPSATGRCGVTTAATPRRSLAAPGPTTRVSSGSPKLAYQIGVRAGTGGGLVRWSQGSPRSRARWRVTASPRGAQALSKEAPRWRCWPPWPTESW